MAESSSSPYDSPPAASAALLVQLVQEIEQTPVRYWASLLQTIRQFRQGLEVTPSASESAWNEALEAAALSSERQAALSQLLNTWMEDEDEQEQAETWQFLSQALDSDRLSNRSFFP